MYLNILISERVFEGRRELHWNNLSFVITRIEAFDQTSGAGGVLYNHIGGVGYRYVDLYFDVSIEGSTVHFIVNIFGEPPQSNDVILGEILKTNILLERYTISDTFESKFIYFLHF